MIVPTKAAAKLIRDWKGQANPETSRSTYDLPLAALLLEGLALDSDEGPGLDILRGVAETMEGWLRTRADGTPLEVSQADVRLLARRVEVAMELIRRGAGAFEAAPTTVKESAAR